MSQGEEKSPVWPLHLSISSGSVETGLRLLCGVKSILAACLVGLHLPVARFGNMDTPNHGEPQAGKHFG